MGIASYQAGFFYDLKGSYVLSYGIATGVGVINLLVVAALAWYRGTRSSASTLHSPFRLLAAGAVK
jgi:hypothetical protein